MELPDLLLRSKHATDWWVVRGESGRLWTSLFQPRGVVAHAEGVPPFEVGADLESRCRVMLGLQEYFVKEVNDFIDEMDTDHVVITPDQGSRAAWFGIVTSDWFASPEHDHWMQRKCDWYENLVPLGLAASTMPPGQRGTVFNVTKHSAALRRAIEISIE